MPFSKEERNRQKAEQFRQQAEEGVEDENNNDVGDMKPCCLPSGCFEDELVNTIDPDDVQKVVCNNPDCKYGMFMHKSCFFIFEEDVLTYLRSSGRARSWSEKQRKQNLWTKKGYDLAWKACSCKCGKGHLRKDLEWLPPKPLEGEKQKQRKRRKSSDKPSIGRSNSVSNGNGHTSGNGHVVNGNGHVNGNISLLANGNGKGRSRHTSTSSTDSKDGHSPPVSPGGHGHVLSPQHSPRSSGSNGMTPSGIIQEQQRERVRNASGGSQNKKSHETGTQGHAHSGKNGMIHLGGGDNKQRPTNNNKQLSNQGKNKNAVSPQQQHQQCNYFFPSNINMWNGVNEKGYPNEPPKIFGNANQSGHGGADSCSGKNHFTGFLPRLDLSTFFQVLPAHKLNAYHIQMEEDNQESEEIRAFIFSTLSTYGVQTVSCSQCLRVLPVFDRYPLIDGTFYLTPVRYGDSNLCISIPGGGGPDRNPQYLAAVCMQCLEGVQSIVCRICKSQWDGSHYQLGTLYSYDIFAASPCCPGRAGCKRCGKPVLDLTKGMHYFSEFSRSIRCPHCGIPDFHCVKPLSSYEVHDSQQINVF